MVDNDVSVLEAKLLIASDKNDNETVADLIRQGVNVNVVGKGGWSPLIHATYQSYLDTVKLLVEAGADINAFHGKWNAFMYAVKYKNTDIIKFFVESGADINVSDSMGDTPLIYAAEEGDPDIIKILVNAGANVNATNLAGWTAMHHAAWQGYVNIMKILVVAGGDIKKKNKDGFNPIKTLKMQYPDSAPPESKESSIDECVKNLEKFVKMVRKLKREDNKHSVITNYEFDL